MGLSFSTYSSTDESSVALVGPSGCGKSTTIQMLERFYDPLIGQVTLDGVDIRELNPVSFRSQMALVSQEPTLYAGTVRFNILLGANKPMEEVTEEEIIQACKNANIVSPYPVNFVKAKQAVRFHHLLARWLQHGSRRQRIPIVRRSKTADSHCSCFDSKSQSPPIRRSDLSPRFAI